MAPDTKATIVAAALESLREDGFAGASARAIARRGDFNQALIFYHFGSVDGLLLAALDDASDRQRERYERALASAASLEDKIAAAVELYREDLRSGHVTVITELIAGSVSRPELAPEVVRRMQPWVDLTEATLREAFDSAGVAAIVDPRSAAVVVVALSLGVNLIELISPDDAHAERMFELAERLGTVVAPMLRTDAD